LSLRGRHIALNDKHESEMFFWLMTRRHFQPKDRLVIWFNGGKGISHMDGVFMETGPYRPRADGMLDINRFSWHDNAHVLFVDQPIGTGFSYTKDKYFHTTLPGVARDMRTFLREFFKVFPEYAESEIYMAGESYAGVYIPYIAKELLDGNKRPNTDLKVNLAGLALGNPWLDPYSHYTTYLDFAQKYNLIEGQYLDRARNVVQQCLQEFARNSKRIKLDVCENIFNQILEFSYKTETNGTKSCMNIYDKRLRDPYPECGMAWPPILPHMYAYLARTDVVEAIHAQGKKKVWVECDPDVMKYLSDNDSPSSHLLLPDLLKQIRVLLFSGDQDVLCNHLGTELAIERLTWNGATGFQDAPRKLWSIDDKPAGLWQESRNLTYARIFNGSHMVAVDKTRETYDMINRFMGMTSNGLASVVHGKVRVVMLMRHTAALCSQAHMLQSKAHINANGDVVLSDGRKPASGIL
ncbi:Alpha/Beta hydrolase protein, partial [Thamnocephalis sphaerospora]